MPTPAPLIAALTPHTKEGTDDLLASFVLAKIEQGWRIRGLLQETIGIDNTCEITLIDLDDNSRHLITQDLGTCSSACRLNTEVMSEAGGALRRITAGSADLVVINRFGKEEAEGRGFASEMLELMSNGIPVLTVVQDKHLDLWRHFTGGLACELPAERAALECWFSSLAAGYIQNNGC